MSLPADDLALGLELADVADAITLARYRTIDLRVQTKPDLTPVTEADTAVEQALRERLAAVRPDDAVIGEELGTQAGDGARRWILDPIDGTKNYVRGLPVWATLIAMQEGAEVTVGVVSAPALGRRWWASRGGGAFTGDGAAAGPRRLGTSSVSALADAQLLFSELELWEARGRLDALMQLVRSCWRSRAPGDFWNYMLVAEGAAEIAVEPEVEVWDLAAVQVIVEEAGGRFTDLAGGSTAEGGDALASNGLVHDEALEIIGR